MAERIPFEESGREAYEIASGIASIALNNQVSLPSLPSFGHFGYDLSKLRPVYEYMQGEQGLFGRRSLHPEVVFVPHNTSEENWNRIMLGIAGKHNGKTRGLETFYNDRSPRPEITQWEPAVMNGSGLATNYHLGALKFLKGDDLKDTDLLPTLDSYLALQTKRMFLGKELVDSSRPPVWTRLADTGRPTGVIQPTLANLFDIEDIHLRGSWDSGLRISEDISPDWDNGIKISRNFSYDAPRIIVTAGKIGVGRLLGFGEGGLRPTILASQV